MASLHLQLRVWQIDQELEHQSLPQLKANFFTKLVQVQIFRTLWENHLRQSSEKQISIQKNITFVSFIIEGAKVCYAVMAQLFTVNPDLSVSAEGRILVKLHSYTCCKLLDEYTSLRGHWTISFRIFFGSDLIVGSQILYSSQREPSTALSSHPPSRSPSWHHLATVCKRLH